MAKKTIDQATVTDRRVLMRVDFNVPIEGGRITDDRRITQALDSIRSVIDRSGRLILMSHLGRPKGTGPEPALSLAPVAHHLSKLLERPVAFAGDCIGRVADSAAKAVTRGGVLMLENLRFHAEETLIDSAGKKGTGNREQGTGNRKQRTGHREQGTDSLDVERRGRIDAFARALAKNADLYCNNAFGTCHRKHVSLYDVPLLLGPGKRVCGDLVEKELRFLGDALSHPRRPFVAILGGAKVSDKIGVIENLLNKVDAILIGGAMTYTFLAAQGKDVGSSLHEHDKLDIAKGLLAKSSGKLRLPCDNICAPELKEGAATTVSSDGVPPGLMGLDIGPKTIAAYASIIRTAKTIVWNGPMGVFEKPPFDKGTVAIARALADATELGATTIIGGGDTAAAVEAAGLADKMTHISTGGGASLEFLEGKPFATIEILDDA